MAEAASGAGDVTLEGERGKRPPPEGEPAAPASGVLGIHTCLPWARMLPLPPRWKCGGPCGHLSSLLRGADELGLRKAVKAEFGGGTRSFSCEEDFIYENVESELRFFTSQERQSIIRFWLQNLRAKQGEALHNVRFLEDQPIIPELAARGIIQQVFPVHEQRILNRLMKSWVQAVCENQPLDDICDYFGVKIAMYFAWLGFYTSAMVYPAVFGSVLYTFTEADQTSRDVSCVVFALFNVIWSTLFLEEWKRRGAELAYKWGTLDSPGEAVEEPRPQFRGIRRISPITRAEEFYYPPWKRLLFQLLVSLPLCLACLICVFILMLGCFQLQELVLSVKGLPRLVRFLPKVMLALLVSVSAEGYKKLAVWLNDMENYRLESTYERHLIIKVVLFQFVNSYLSLFYIGFYLKDMDRLKEVRACAPSQGQHPGPLGMDPCKGSRALQPLPPVLHPSLLFVRLSMCPFSACRSPLPSVRPPVRLVPPQLLLLLSLTQSLERQLQAVLVPLAALRFRLLLLSLRGLLLVARAKMLATLLITRQLLQNVREVLQPHLYRRLGSGELGLRTILELARALLGLLNPLRPDPRRHLEAQADEGGAGSRRCLGGGCGAPEEENEEEEEAAVERRPAGEGGEVPEGPRGGKEEDEEEDDDEDEDEEYEGEEGSLLDCGLRLKKVSFAERGAGRRRPGPSPDGLLEEGSPTMVEKGLEPGVFTLAEEDDEPEGPPGSPGPEPQTVLLRRARGEGRDQGPDGDRDTETGSGDAAGRQKRHNRSSWIDPPEEEHSPQLTQAELESCMKKYEDTFQDYQEMFVQFGYVVLFSSAFPLAALCALVNNLIEIRSDAFKLCTGLQRPFGRRVESIGQWQKVMEAMGVLAIVVNCYLIGQCGQLQRLFPWLSPEAAIVSVVVLEHLALLVKYLIHVAIPDIPGWVAEEMAKLEYQRREAFKRHERQAQQRFQQQQRRRREEEERQRHAEQQARRERDTGGREEARAEAPGPDPVAERGAAKAKGSERPRRPGALLPPGPVLRLKQIIPLQTRPPAPTGCAPPPRSPADTRLPAFLSLRFLKAPERGPSPPRPGKLFAFSAREPSANGAPGGGARAHRSAGDEPAAAEPEPRPEDAGSASPPAGCWRWDAPWGCGDNPPRVPADVPADAPAQPACWPTARH
ncbi:anoctamin-8 isoform X3 [Mus musculus]|uniref:anoctamin-8 isoform X3 n=1 Tax=Mus musculus TaxID=10090 RepID=UPI0007ECA82D|nr:anoctamin-8 isoform X3 [Mus musculus]|eukprot:XP_017168362.1 PREDICTED: anoctamin-8 isoform X3 [Mus musculus]